MQFLRTPLRIGDDREAGLSLLEVVVAMLVFALVSTGVVYSMISVLRVTKESRDRQVAANLAAQEIDLARDVEDLFTLLPEQRDVVLNGDTFRVNRFTSWVSNAAVELPCGAGGGTLKYKRVNVEVTWDNMRPGSEPVRADTVIDPANRINDPTLGTILVSVLGESGSGRSGVTVTAVPDPGTPSNTARTLSTSPAPTDAQGCSYILKVVPGTYKVTITKTGYVSDGQQTPATMVVPVTAGTSISAGFAYDLGGPTTFTYASGTTKVPIALHTSFASSYGVYTTATTTASQTRAITLFPLSSGYDVFAGQYLEPSETSAGCVNVDPGQWIAGNRNGQTVEGVRAPRVPVAPGAQGSADVPMGVLSISGTSNRTLTATTSSTRGPGDPGCAVPMTYTFTASTSGNTTIALPFGSWVITERNSSGGGGTSTVAGNRMTLLTTGTVSGTVLTLDPRVEP